MISLIALKIAMTLAVMVGVLLVIDMGFEEDQSPMWIVIPGVLLTLGMMAALAVGLLCMIWGL